MRAVIFDGPGRIRVGERPDPTIQDPSDVVVQVTLACICGSDLWYFRGQSDHAIGPIGHEFIGIVDKVGTSVREFQPGDRVVAPFVYGDGSCVNCLAGWPNNCLRGAPFGNNGIDGGQGQAVRVPFADATLVKIPRPAPSESVLRSILTLSDVMCTGHHAAVSAGVRPGDTVAVVGDGAVGLCAVLASKRLGARRIIALSRNPTRQALARKFGATDVLGVRGEAAKSTVLEMTDGLGVDAAMECVGTADSMTTAFEIARVGATVGAVGAPHGVVVPVESIIFRNVGVRGGVSPARRYSPELMGDVLKGTIEPGLVFDFVTNLDGAAEAYRVMNDRRAIKSLIRIEE